MAEQGQQGIVKSKRVTGKQEAVERYDCPFTELTRYLEESTKMLQLIF